MKEHLPYLWRLVLQSLTLQLHMLTEWCIGRGPALHVGPRPPETTQPIDALLLMTSLSMVTSEHRYASEKEREVRDAEFILHVISLSCQSLSNIFTQAKILDIQNILIIEIQVINKFISGVCKCLDHSFLDQSSIKFNYDTKT